MEMVTDCTMQITPLRDEYALFEALKLFIIVKSAFWFSNIHMDLFCRSLLLETVGCVVLTVNRIQNQLPAKQ